MSTIWGRLRPLSADERRLLCALAVGSTLKVHRDLDGSKVHRLHPLNEPVQSVDDGVVNGLKRRGLIDSNMKFPAATYMLTEKGRRAVLEIVDIEYLPLSSRSYSG